MAHTSSNTSHPLAVMVQLQNPPEGCHSTVDPGAELFLGSATPSTDREKFAQLHQQQWQLNKVILWLWTLTSPMWRAKQGLLPAQGWERNVQIRKCSSSGGRVWLFPEADLGHWLSFIPSAATSLQSPSQGCQSQVTVALLFLTKEALLPKPEPFQEYTLYSTKGKPRKYFCWTIWCS